MSDHDHAALRADLEAHIARDAQEHAEALERFDQHVTEAPAEDRDHAALRALLVAHIERTQAGHGRLMAALDRHIEDFEP